MDFTHVYPRHPQTSFPQEGTFSLPQVVPQQRGPRHRQYLLAAAASLRENGEHDMGQTSQKSYENDECQWTRDPEVS